jgi:hypothetical protein
MDGKKEKGMKAINYLLVLMLLVGVISCGEDVEKSVDLPPIKISDISETQIQDFVRAMRESDQDEDGWVLYPKIEYAGNGEMVIGVNHRWFSAPADMAINNVITVYGLWLSMARNENVTLTIMFEDFEYIKFQNGKGKVIISSKDKKAMLKRIMELEKSASRNHRLKGSSLSV